MYPIFTCSNINKFLDRHYNHVRLTLTNHRYMCNIPILKFKVSVERFPIFSLLCTNIQFLSVFRGSKEERILVDVENRALKDYYDM